VTWVRLFLVGVAALLAAGAVSAAGLIGFVGLVVPHLARLLVGPDYRCLLPASALLGAGLVVAADTAARTVAAPLELPVGSVLALLGAPYFLYLLWRGGRWR
jgi:iron complex transport system permease protein